MSHQEELDERFVKKCIEASKLGVGTQWIADELRLTKRYVINHRRTLIVAGVKFPPLVNGRIKVNTKEHAKRLNELMKGYWDDVV